MGRDEVFANLRSIQSEGLWQLFRFLRFLAIEFEKRLLLNFIGIPDFLQHAHCEWKVKGEQVRTVNHLIVEGTGGGKTLETFHIKKLKQMLLDNKGEREQLRRGERCCSRHTGSGPFYFYSGSRHLLLILGRRRGCSFLTSG